MHHRARLVMTACLVLVAPACPSATEGDGDGGDEGRRGEGEGEGAEGEGEAGEGEGETGEGEGEGEAGEGEGEGEPLGCGDVVGLALTPGRRLDDALRLVWEVVANATVVSGGQTLRTTGTLDARGAQPTYVAQPTNELVFLDDGVEVRVVVSTFSGDFGVDEATAFYVRQHDVVFSNFRFAGDAFDGESHLGSTGAGTRSGDGVFGDGTTFTVASQQAATFDFGTGTVETNQEELRTGTLGGRPGLALTFEEQHAYRAVLVDNFAERLDTGLAVAGTADGVAWSMTDGLIRRTFSNGAAVEPDFWAQTGGTLTRAGQPAGVLDAVTSSSAIEIRCGTDVLERHAR